VALDPSTHDGLAKLTASLKERASSGENLSSTYVMWGFFTAAAMISAIAVLFTPQADRRISQAMNTPSPAMQQGLPQGIPPAGQPVPGAPALARIEPPPPAKAEPDPELLARLKLLEEQLDNVTGSIAKQAAAPPPPPPPPPGGVTPSSEPKQVKTAPVAQVETDGEAVGQNPAPAAAASADPVTTASIPAAASLPATTFGLDLGSESSFGALRARWEALRREHPELGRLQPKMSVRDNKGRVELRLIAGPFANAADAARVCAQLFVKGVSCDGGLFDGQRLPQS
jgi:SPOR domain